jgi:CheY-like chemotaxis protein/HPt (histidine-containing phosphotransfer) domain-containing protein
VLTLEGAQATLRESGQEALNSLESRPDDFDVVLMDLQMPGLDGCQTTERIHQQSRRQPLPVIALTAGATATEQGRAAAAGMADFLMKPIDPVKLVRVVRQHVERSQCRILPVVLPKTAPERPAPASQADWPELPGIDTHEVRQRLGGDQALYAQLLDRLLHESGELIASAQASARQHDQPAARAHLHKLRGQAANIGARSIAALLSQLEHDAQAGQLQADALTPVRTAFDAIKTRWASLQPAARNDATDDLAAPLDPQQLQQLIDQLGKKRYSAVTLYQSLQSALRQVLGESTFTQLDSAMHQMDFAAAAELLKQADAGRSHVRRPDNQQP